MIVDMDSRQITRLMVDTAVARGIRDMADDPARSLRRLADMGKQFSTGRFQPQIISIIQELLEHEDSPYYPLLSEFLGTTDHESIRCFGINMGYECWTYGARLLRESSAARGIALPWILFFRYAAEGRLRPDDIGRLLDEAYPLGINAAYITLTDCGPDKELVSMLLAHPTCGFFLQLESGGLSCAEMGRLSECHNTLLIVNADAPEAEDTCRALKEAHILFAAYHSYEEEELPSMGEPAYMKRFLPLGASILFFIQSDTCKVSAGPIIKDLRLHPVDPCFLWDLYADERAVSDRICDMPARLCIDSDGRVLVPGNTAINVLSEGMTLDNILTRTMPLLPAEDMLLMSA